MRDLCPHRGIPLSAGWFDGERVTCKYHGWEFEPCSGPVHEDPSLDRMQDTLDPTRSSRAAYACEERDGYAWVYVPEPGSGMGARSAAELAAGAGGAEVHDQIPHGASRRRPALQRGSRHHRADGSGAWAVRAPVVVVAFSAAASTRSRSTLSRSWMRSTAGATPASAWPRTLHPATACRTSCWARTGQ